MPDISKDSFFVMSWDEYQRIADDLSMHIADYATLNGITFDFLVPILRGGGVLAISLSHSLGITSIFPIQYKYKYDNEHIDNSIVLYKPSKLMFSLELLKDTEKEHSILVTEGNHCTGQTSQMCIDEIKRLLPNSKIFYASIGRDYSYTKKLNNTEYEWWGMYTNESETLSHAQCDEKGIINKFSVYPWENLDEEIQEVADSMIYHNSEGV